MGNLQRSDSGGGACLAHGLMQRLSSPGFTDAHNVARSGRGSGQKGVFVADRASGFAASAIDSNVERHGLFLSQGNGRPFHGSMSTP